MRKAVKKARETRVGYNVRTKKRARSVARKNTQILTPNTAFQFQTTIAHAGKLQLKVPLPDGTQVVVFVVQQTRSAFADLVHAAQSSLAFWDNSIDDAEWNNA